MINNFSVSLCPCRRGDKMADSDSVESSTSGAECDGRLRSVGKDMINRMPVDKQSPNKSKSSSAGAPQIGASYLVRRLDDAYRKLLDGVVI